MSNEVMERLKNIKDAVEEILECADRSGIDGAINWADLHCVEAMHCVNHDGYEWDEVLIEEASPDAADLCNYVGKELLKIGLSVVVKTEW